MSRPPTNPGRIQITGIGDEAHRPPGPPRFRALVAGILVGAAAVLISVVAGGTQNGDAPITGHAAEFSGTRVGGSRLLHPLGGPVDTVEQFITRVNYGQTDIDVQMFGCRSSEAASETQPVTVDCAVVIDSNSLPDLEADHERRSVSFLVSDGLISSASIVESPLDEGSDLNGLFNRWLEEFYFSGP